jgi:hypothetical protein
MKIGMLTAFVAVTAFAAPALADYYTVRQPNASYTVREEPSGRVATYLARVTLRGWRSQMAQRIDGAKSASEALGAKTLSAVCLGSERRHAVVEPVQLRRHRETFGWVSTSPRARPAAAAFCALAVD